MARKKETPRRIRVFFMSPLIIYVATFVFLWALGLLVFILYFALAQNDNILIIMVSIVMSILIISSIIVLPPLWAKITIDENGISKSFLGRFFKVQMSWDEITEVAFARMVMFVYGALWFSKTKRISEIRIDRRYKVKDSIVLTLSRKRYAVIKQYIKQPIIDLSEEEAKSIGLE